MPGPVKYDDDVVAWSSEQARLLRAGRFDLLDIEHIADEIEDVGKSEARELENRMSVLLMHLLKWQYQPERRGRSWEITIRNQRQAIERRLQRTPSLRPWLADPDWWSDAWGDALAALERETGMLRDDVPEVCPWPLADILGPDWLP